MPIKHDVETVLAAFEKDTPELRGKAYLTSMDRSWEEQLDIIIDPKRSRNYPNIKKEFLDKFTDLDKKLPTRRSDMSKDQLTWWRDAILKQAGKSPGFPHVGGNAVDISVKNLDKDARTDLSDRLKKALIKVLMDLYQGVFFL